MARPSLPEDLEEGTLPSPAHAIPKTHWSTLHGIDGLGVHAPPPAHRNVGVKCLRRRVGASENRETRSGLVLWHLMAEAKTRVWTRVRASFKLGARNYIRRLRRVRRSPEEEERAGSEGIGLSMIRTKTKILGCCGLWSASLQEPLPFPWPPKKRN